MNEYWIWPPLPKFSLNCEGVLYLVSIVPLQAGVSSLPGIHCPRSLSCDCIGLSSLAFLVRVHSVVNEFPGHCMLRTQISHLVVLPKTDNITSNSCRSKLIDTGSILWLKFDYSVAFLVTLEIKIIWVTHTKTFLKIQIVVRKHVHFVVQQSMFGGDWCCPPSHHRWRARACVFVRACGARTSTFAVNLLDMTRNSNIRWPT